MNNNKSRWATWCLTALLGLAGGCKPNDSTAETPRETPTIRVITQGFAKMPEYVEALKVAIISCRVAKRCQARQNSAAGPCADIPDEVMKLPSEKFLAELPIQEKEVLFDGPLIATYETQTSVSPDIRSNCDLKLFRYYSAEVSKSCTSRSSGQSTSIGDLVNFEHPVDAGWEVNEEEKRNASDKARCVASGAKQTTSTKGLPRESTAKGPDCVWERHISRRMMLTAGMTPSPDAALLDDACVHPVWNPYPYGDEQGNRSTITLKSRMDAIRETEKIFPEQHGVIVDTSLYEEGKPIPPARFTRAAIEAHLKQPARLSLGGQ